MTSPSDAISGSSSCPLEASIKHPLMGARLGVLLKAFARHGLPAPQKWPLAAAMTASAAARLPLRPLEAITEKRRRATNPTPETPVFIVGHWRSGTTHLHNLLGRAPQFGHISPIASGLPDEILTVGRWFRKQLEAELPETRGIDAVAVRPDSPQEDEIPLASLQSLSIYHALYFPRDFEESARAGIFFDGASEREIARWRTRMRRFAEKIALQQDKPQLLIKNPVYTARIGELRRIWPEAKFISIHRNPYEVFVSTVGYNRKMLKELALQPYDHVDIERFVTGTFLDMMAAYDRDTADLGPDRLAEVSFEALEADPLAVCGSIFEQLALPGWSQAKPEIVRYLDRLKGYEKNPYAISEADAAHVEATWGAYLDRWGYARRPPCEGSGPTP